MSLLSISEGKTESHCLLSPASLLNCSSWSWDIEKAIDERMWKCVFDSLLETVFCISISSSGCCGIAPFACQIETSSFWKRERLSTASASLQAAAACINIITQLCISPQPQSLSHPSVRDYCWWSCVKLRRVQTLTRRSFTQYVACLLCLYPVSTSQHF